jgi:hypothetical protein
MLRRTKDYNCRASRSVRRHLPPRPKRQPQVRRALRSRPKDCTGIASDCNSRLWLMAAMTFGRPPPGPRDVPNSRARRIPPRGAQRSSFGVSSRVGVHARQATRRRRRGQQRVIAARSAFEEQKIAGLRGREPGGRRFDGNFGTTPRRSSQGRNSPRDKARSLLLPEMGLVSGRSGPSHQILLGLRDRSD